MERAVSAARRGAVSSVICRNILVRPDVQKAMADHGVFAVYLASEDEIDLGDLIAALKHKGVLVAAPRWNGELYTLARLDIEDLQEGPHHILEPHEDNPVAPVQPRPLSRWGWLTRSRSSKTCRPRLTTG